MANSDDWGAEKLASRVDEFDAIRSGGPLVENRYLTPEEIHELSTNFPPIMGYFWKKYPIGSLFKGAYWLCHPRHFSPLMPMIFKGDPDFDPIRTHVLGYTAFGRMVAWSHGTRIMVRWK